MRSFLSYLGGKSLLTNKIIPKMPDHHCYCEVFAGAAWMLFKKNESPVEIINDINTDLCTLYRVVKLHLEEFIRYLKWILVARDEFARFRQEATESLTDIQRAVRFYYLLRCGYGGKVYKPSFNINTTRPSGFNLLRIEEELSAVHLRLSRVYLDPPYYGFEDCYGKGIFSREEYAALRDRLAGLQGKFILSINDVPEIRQLFKAFKIETIKTSYTAAGGNRRKSVGELLIRNY